LLELPDSCRQVWNWFLDLHSTRSSNGFGPNPISFSEIKSYFDLASVEPDDWEVQLLRRFDHEVLDLSAKQMEKERKKQEASKK
jgi:hypothetical protein